MNRYFDTSAIFPALVEAHPRFQDAELLLEDSLKHGGKLVISNHLCAELYSNLTRFPIGDKILPDQATRLIDALKKISVVVNLDEQDYISAIRRCSEKNLVSGVVYDAIHLEAALKGGCQQLITANPKDFSRLVNESDPISIIPL